MGKSKFERSIDHRNEGFEAKDAYYENNVERVKSINRSIITKQGLPDYTDKELQAMGGTVYAYNFNAPIPWKDFKALPLQTRKDYINYLIKKYSGLRLTDLADMFGVNAGTLGTYMRDIGIEFHRGGGRYMNDGRLRFKEEMLPHEQVEPEKPKEETAPEVQELSFILQTASFTCDAKDVSNILSRIGMTGMVTIKAEAV